MGARHRGIRRIVLILTAKRPGFEYKKYFDDNIIYLLLQHWKLKGQ
jgi:hypothetical protein